MKRVLVYCGAAAGHDPHFIAAAYGFGHAVAERGWGIIYGGHHAGMMGAVAQGCRKGGGLVTGILPDVLKGKEQPPEGIELVRVADMHARKTLMVQRCAAMVALPGGYGTLDELFEQLTWRVIGLHDKPVAMFDVVVDGVSYWAPLLAFLDHATRAGFVKETARALPIVDDDAGRLLDRIGVIKAP